MSSKKTKILIVDDEQDLREILRDEFQGAGWEVDEAVNGENAFKLIEKKSFDIVVSDVRMPGGTGLELLKKVRERDPKTPLFVLISGYADISSDDAIRRGAQGIISKPFDLTEVVNRLKKLLG